LNRWFAHEFRSGLLFFAQPLPTTWTTIAHDPDKNYILFHLNLAGKAVIRLEIRIQAVGQQVSQVKFRMILTALDQETNAMAVETIREKLEFILNMLTDSLKHYCETGDMIS